MGSSAIAFESASADLKLGLRGLFNFDTRAYPGAAEFSALSVARARASLSHIHTEFDPAPGATPSGGEDAVLARMRLTF